MKLIMAVVNKDDLKSCTNELMKGGFQVTRLASSGGLVHKSCTLLVGVRQERLEAALEIIKHSCRSRKYPITKIPMELRTENSSISDLEDITVGGATVFVLEIEQFQKL